MKKEINFITIRPADLAKRLLKNWYWFVLLAGLGYWGAELFLEFQTELYEIEASLKIKEEEENIGRKAIVQDMGFNESINLEDEIFTLKASPLMKKVVENLKLDVTYFSVGKFKETELYDKSPVKAAVVGNKELAEGRSLHIAPLDSTNFYLILTNPAKDTLSKSYGNIFTLDGIDYIVNRENKFEKNLKVYFLRPDEVAEYYSQELAIYPIGRTKILNFLLVEAVPQKGIDLIEKLIEYYGASIVEEKNESARKSLSFIDERLSFITEELFRAERNVESYQNRIHAPLGIENIAAKYSMEIESSNLGIAELSSRRDFLTDLLSFINKKENEFSFLTVPSEAGGEMVNSLVAQYNKLIVDREELLLSADLGNPFVKLMDEQLGTIKSSLRESVNILVTDISKKIGNLNATLAPAIANLNAIPQQQRELVTITRLKNSKEELYMYLLENREKAGLSIASQTINLKVIDPPANIGLVSPIYHFIYTIGILLGLLLPLVFIVGSEFLDDTIHYEKDIKEYTDTPFLGNIGLASNKKELVVVNGSRSAIAESFHLLRSNLQFMTPNDAKSQVIMFTSNVSGDGKTFIASNLGASLALAGKKTILVSFDLRKPKLASYVSGAKSEVGVSNFLMNPKSRISKLINTVDGFENLYFIGSGPIPPNPTDLIHKNRTKELFDYLRANFDMILVDTAPVGLVSDALALSKHIDASIFIMRYKLTSLGQISLADELYSSKKLPNLSIVLNGIKKRRYGYAYAYGSDYGYGYYNEEVPKWKRWFSKKEKTKNVTIKTQNTTGNKYKKRNNKKKRTNVKTLR